MVKLKAQIIEKCQPQIMIRKSNFFLLDLQELEKFKIDFHVNYNKTPKSMNYYHQANEKKHKLHKFLSQQTDKEKVKNCFCGKVEVKIFITIF
jgi:hypothetical protein